ncbi:globin domain-containing protein [Ruegeria sp. 2012CJ15-1]
MVPIAKTAADLFYDRLFELDPAAAELFATTDMAEQKVKLLQTLATVISSLHAPTPMLQDILDLGQRHAGYGVTADHYDLVGSALLWTLEQALGEAWTEETYHAWSQAYQLIAEQMLKGAAEGAISAVGSTQRTA